jgi:hypothetical protein
MKTLFVIFFAIFSHSSRAQFALLSGLPIKRPSLGEDATIWLTFFLKKSNLKLYSKDVIAILAEDVGKCQVLVLEGPQSNGGRVYQIFEYTIPSDVDDIEDILTKENAKLIVEKKRGTLSPKTASHFEDFVDVFHKMSQLIDLGAEPVASSSSMSIVSGKEVCVVPFTPFKGSWNEKFVKILKLIATSENIDTRTKDMVDFTRSGRLLIANRKLIRNRAWKITDGSDISKIEFAEFDFFK